jgi:hypothetical protein
LTAPEESITDYDSIHHPRWRARARSAGVRSNPGGGTHEVLSLRPAGPRSQQEPKSLPPDSPLLAAANPTHAIWDPLKSHR